MPIAKSSEPSPTLTAPVLASPVPPGVANYEWQGIPIDVLRNFNIELGTIPTKDLEMIRDITTWAKGKVGNEGSIGDMLQEISKIQRQLGAPSPNERSYEKTWRFIKAQKVIDEMTKRQDSLRGSSQWI